MCGIVGALAFGKFSKAEEAVRREAIIFICTQLLQMTVERGKDATGVSMLFNDGNFTGLKMGIPSPDFIARYGDTEKDFEGMLKIAREYAKPMSVFLGHCRKATVGNTYENQNNQPVQVGETVLIHNGTIENHNIIFDNLKCERTGDVDSESIARLLFHYSNNGQEPYTLDMLSEVTKRLDGSFSVLGFNGNNPFQVFQFRDARPAEIVLVRPLKTVFIASEKKFLENTLFEFNKMGRLFTPGLKFPHLKKENVEFETLPDESMCIWDLTKEVAEETKLKELNDWKKIVVVANKIWKAPAKTYNNGTHYSSGYNSAVGGTKSNGWEGSHNPAAPSNAQSKTNVAGTGTKTGAADEDGDDDSESAFLWNSKLRKYAKDSAATAPEGAVEVNADSGKVTAEVESIPEVPKKETEGLICSPAEVEEHGPATETNSSEEEIPSTKKGTTTTVKTVDMKVDAEAVGKAKEYIEKGLVKFEDNEEVLEALNVTHAESLSNLPLFALANRIAKFMAAKYFHDGYVARKSEEGGKQVASSKIKTLKTVARILGKTLDGFKENKVNKGLKKTLEEMPRAVKAISPEDLTVITESDTKASVALSALKGKIVELKKE
jgi:predicted glutamine amidotransferase